MRIRGYSIWLLSLIALAVLAVPGATWAQESRTGPVPPSGPNDGLREDSPSNLAGGALIVHHPPDIEYSAENWCALYSEYGIASSDEQNTRIEISGMTSIWYVIAAWDGDKTWCGVEFGFDGYDPAAYYFIDSGPCLENCIEIPSSGWPGPNEGTAIVRTDTCWEGNWLPVYWFGGYAYYEGLICLCEDPTTGFTGFGNCLAPAETWAPYEVGCMGIGRNGVPASPASLAACCNLETNECLILHEESCDAIGGTWLPEEPSCDPNPCLRDWADHDVGNLTFTVTDQGILGFMDCTQSLGSGFVYPGDGANHLYIGSLWVGDDPTRVANRDYDPEPVKEWVVSSDPDGHIWQEKEGDSDQDLHVRYTDAGATYPQGLIVNQESWAFANPDLADGFVIIRYSLTLQGASPMIAHVGCFLDPDIGGVATDDTGSRDEALDLIYMTDGSGIYIGVCLLQDESGEEPPGSNLTLIDNDMFGGNSYIPDETKYGLLTASAPHYTIPEATVPGNYRILAAAGPVSLLYGEDQLVAFAILGAQSLEELEDQVHVARLVYWGGIQSAPHPISAIPRQTRVLPSVPNPFTRQTEIRFDLSQPGEVDLGIYDVSGRSVRRLAEGWFSPMQHVLTWDSRDDTGRLLPSGIYFVRLSLRNSPESMSTSIIRVR
ncbi:MAG: hypothetical protein KAY32_03245 [Candidatus Eisenbacteria sp.]|nr:hypothetical protein [Candidatus Eisenbacteria bacterium]